MQRVAAFTDTYLPTVNGVTYTVESWRDRWVRDGGRMDVVYPDANGHTPAETEHPVKSLPFPFYDGFRLGTPRIPSDVRDAELVHTHTPFAIGLGGLRLARNRDLPLVASYHTPTSEYANYVSPTDAVASALGRVCESYERWFLEHADAVLAPSAATRDHVRDEVGVDTPVEIVPNGVDVERFRPVEADDFRASRGLDTGRPLIGYTGRHGYEKRLSELVAAAAGMDVTLVFGGDGPARADLERQAESLGADAHFLGFLDRDEMPAFYSALDTFAFPSPVETQGLVALEANACGTPVVGANAGALANTIDDGETGYHYESGDIDDFRAAIRRTLAERDELREACLARRDEVSVERAVERLADVYRRVR
ncbi:glycosyltransferase family 4 protein [Halorussus amylolyticus]|uniref:glycosyltransferase family 4 protein n=1 Tax=Halorussus amylolyticus TaxID=1126242 RepID=UPI0010428F45|nr:glycosyltransferase family 4 protein [Halorussus amylolyticus]